MKRHLSLVCFCLAVTGQDQDPAVKKNSVSVHTVERGSMSIVAGATGTLISLQPARAIFAIVQSPGKCEPGRGARLVLGENQRPLAGKVVGRTEAGQCEVEVVEALPQGTLAGSKVGGLIVVDELKDVVFFGRPATAQPNSTATIFVLDGASHARRATIRYGAMSGPLIQVIQGLSPGDKVIVTDMSKWAHLPRVRLE